MSAKIRFTADSPFFSPVAASLYAGLLAIAAWKHTFWRDETQAWLIARDSHSLGALVHNVRYEGHPPLWHLVLYCITFFTANPAWMKLPNFLFSVAAACMILSVKELPAWVRAGFVFSYFILFEYAVIDRNYMIGIMFLVAALTWLKDETSAFKTPLALSLAAWTSLPALILAFCLYPFHLKGVLAAARPRGFRQWLSGLGPRRILALLFFLTCVLGAIAIIRPPADSGALLGMGINGSILQRSNMRSVAVAYLPVPSSIASFWNTSLLLSLGHHAGAVLGFALLISLLFSFRSLWARYFFVTANGLLLIEMAISGRAVSMRYLGWLFVVLLLTVIVESLDSANHAKPPSAIAAGPYRGFSWRSALLVSILSAQVATALFAIAVSLRHPFSYSPQVASFLRQQHLADAPLIFEPDYVSESVLAYLQRPSAYDLEHHAQGSFVIWDRDEYLLRHIPTPQELSAASQNGNSPVLITEAPLTADQIAGLRVKLLASFTGASTSDDRYYIYR